MILIIFEIAILFLLLVAFFVWVSYSWLAIVFGLLLSFAIGWGLVSAQLSNELRSLVRVPGTKSSVVNITAVYENPSEHREFIRLNWMISNNIRWGWLIWSTFLAFAYFAAYLVRGYFDVPHT